MTVGPWDPIPSEPRGELGTRESWAAAKQIDGIAGEWTYPLWVSRAVRFHVPVRSHYERLRDYDAVLETTAIASIVEEAHLRPPSIRTVFAAYESCLDTEDGVLTIPESDERFLGHHEVQIIGWNPGNDELVFGNSWGAKWGAGNTGVMSRSYYEAHAKESWMRIVGNEGLGVPDGFEFFDPALKRRELVRAWKRGPRQGRVPLSGGRTIVWFAAKSLRSVGQTYVGELRDSRRVKLGWCNVSIGAVGGHIHALVTDLYVWPQYRRQGVGHALYEWALHVAEDESAGAFQVLVHEADAESSHEIARENMAKRLGLRWFDAHPEDAAHGVSALAARYLYAPT